MEKNEDEKPIGDSLILSQLTPSMVRRMWHAAMEQNRIAEEEIRELIRREGGQQPVSAQEGFVVRPIYIHFPENARATDGTNALVQTYAARFLDKAPSELPRQRWFCYLRNCWPAGSEHPDSLNLTVDDFRGQELGQVLEGLRKTIPEAQGNIHTFQSSGPVPENSIIPQERRKWAVFPTPATAAA